jgi:hypothetical protein
MISWEKPLSCDQDNRGGRVGEGKGETHHNACSY